MLESKSVNDGHGFYDDEDGDYYDDGADVMVSDDGGAGAAGACGIGGGGGGGAAAAAGAGAGNLVWWWLMPLLLFMIIFGTSALVCIFVACVFYSCCWPFYNTRNASIPAIGSSVPRKKRAWFLAKGRKPSTWLVPCRHSPLLAAGRRWDKS